jgi:primary-amine oxidase
MWQKWDLRLGFSPREGVILSLVHFFDPETDQLRPMYAFSFRHSYSSFVRIYRASLSEMVVPYGNPSPPHYRKNAFDVGEDAIGENLNTLNKDCDCIGICCCCCCCCCCLCYLTSR